jgi:hypothetical protein
VSLQTTEAKGIAQAAAEAWDAHRKQVCSQCSRAAERRRPAERCATGKRLAAAADETRAAARREAARDAAPVPGQGTLW